MARDFEDHCWKDVVSPEALAIYQAYERDIFVGRSPALLAIDLYNLAYDGGARPVHELQKDHPSSCGEFAHAAIAPTQRLFKAARAAGIPIIYTTQETRAEAFPTRVVATRRVKNRTDERSWQIKAEFAPEPGDLMIYKQRASAFYGTPLVAHLQMMGVQSLIVCGESTSGCVRASAVDGYSNGFHVTLAEECCYDRHLLSHKINLFDMHHKYCDVMHTDEIVAHLNGLIGLKKAV
jgi:nicotinamidase-related amidase